MRQGCAAPFSGPLRRALDAQCALPLVMQLPERRSRMRLGNARVGATSSALLRLREPANVRPRISSTRNWT